jgi:hypothetical protein
VPHLGDLSDHSPESDGQPGGERPAPQLKRTNGAGPPTGPTPARPTVGLVVSTRNEAEQIRPFVERVEAALAPFPVDWHAEVIDHSEEAVRSWLARPHRDVLCIIDEDLQHPPEILPELLAPILLGRADICVGSRYLREGSAAGTDGRWRRLAARLSRALVRWLFPATRLTTDPASGLFAVRREVLESIVLRPRGSRVLAEIMVRGTWRSLCDVPYRFEPTADADAHVGAAAALGLAGELISLLRLDPGLASARRNRRRDAEGTSGRRRVAPVQVELLRGGDA